MRNMLILAVALATTSIPAMAQAPVPPRSAAGRVVDSVVQDMSDANHRVGDPLNIEGAPLGTPANPPGTALSRAYDRAVGTNTSGAYPSPSESVIVNPYNTAPSGGVR